MAAARVVIGNLVSVSRPAVAKVLYVGRAGRLHVSNLQQAPCLFGLRSAVAVLLSLGVGWVSSSALSPPCRRSAPAGLAKRTGHSTAAGGRAGRGNSPSTDPAFTCLCEGCVMWVFRRRPSFPHAPRPGSEKSPTDETAGSGTYWAVPRVCYGDWAVGGPTRANNIACTDQKNFSPPTGIAILTVQPILAADLSCAPARRPR